VFHFRLRLIERVLITIGALVILAAGCTTQEQSDLPFAVSAPTARLALNVRLSQSKTAVSTDTRASVVAFPITATSLGIFIGEPSSSDYLQSGPFQVNASTGQIQEVSVAGVPAGLHKRVLIQAKDAHGNVVAEALFYLDFFPGLLTSNDVDLGAPGGGSSASPSCSSSPPVYVVAERVTPGGGSGCLSLLTLKPDAPTRTVLPIVPSLSDPVGVAIDVNYDYVVADYGLGQVIKIDKTTLAPTILASGIPSVWAIARAPDGGFVVGSNNATNPSIYKVSATGGATLIRSFGPGSMIYGVDVNPSGGIYCCVVGASTSPPNKIWFEGSSSGPVYDAGSNYPCGLTFLPSSGEIAVSQRGSTMPLFRMPVDPSAPVTLTTFTSLDFPTLLSRDPLTGKILMAEPSAGRLEAICPSTGARTVLFTFPSGSMPTSAARVK